MSQETDQAVERRFPREWARANDSTLPNRSKARNNLRRRYRLTVEHEAFVAANPLASCGGCSNSTLNPGTINGLACDLDSDFHGYQMVDPKYVCTRFRPCALNPAPAQTSATTNDDPKVRAEADLSGAIEKEI